MKRLWLLFSQAVTVCVAVWFVIATLQPTWLGRGVVRQSGGITLHEAPKEPHAAQATAPGSFSPAARKASPGVVSIMTSKEVRNPFNGDPLFQRLFGTPDQREGMQAFVEKRKPRFHPD